MFLEIVFNVGHKENTQTRIQVELISISIKS